MTALKHPRKLAIAIGITVVLAVYGGLLGIGGMQDWYPSLARPVDIPMWLFGVVQPVYYLICIAILYRLMCNVAGNPATKRSVGLLLGMMFVAESWNYLFLGLRSVSFGFWSLLGFAALAVVVYLDMRRTDRLSSHLFLPYLFWLPVDLVWMYGIWQANP